MVAKHFHIFNKLLVQTFGNHLSQGLPIVCQYLPNNWQMLPCLESYTHRRNSIITVILVVI